MNNALMLAYARQAGLPVSWVDKAIADGKEPAEWRELNEFARLILEEAIRIVNLYSDEIPCSDGYDISTVYRIKQAFGMDQE